VGEANAGIAGGSFDYGPTGLEKATVLGVLDDIEGSAVFDGSAWVLEFGFS
jgi:hypothetical protein